MNTTKTNTTPSNAATAKRAVVGAATFALLLSSACVSEEGDDLSTAQAAVNDGQPSVFHRVVSGGGASLQGNEGASFYDLEVWQDSGSTASLMYFFEGVDPTSEVCVTEQFTPCPPDDLACPCNMDPEMPECQGDEYTYCYYTRFTMSHGWGSIPAEDFQVSPNAARLDTDTSAVPGFNSMHCVYDQTNWSYECTNEGGPITVDWSSNGVWSSFHNGVSRHKYGKYSSQVTGQQRQSSADADGSILGMPLTGSGTINNGKSIQLDIMPSDDPWDPLP
jgi:hypothetical protein